MNHENKIPEISLEELTSSMSNYAKAEIAKQRIEKLEAAGNKLALLMLNGTTAEIRVALWEWRELVPAKKEELK